jgi:hypothetical protein
VAVALVVQAVLQVAVAVAVSLLGGQKSQLPLLALLALAVRSAQQVLAEILEVLLFLVDFQLAVAVAVLTTLQQQQVEQVFLAVLAVAV